MAPSHSSSAATSLIHTLSSNVEVKKLDEVRRQFLKGFIGDKLQEALPRCPIVCMFWDWIYSLYPDNEISSARYSLPPHHVSAVGSSGLQGNS